MTAGEKKRQSGMATLEAAVILPLTLTLVFFMLSAIRLVREDSLIRYAIDQTCEEAALLLPAAEALLIRSSGIDSIRHRAQFEGSIPSLSLR